jgi:ribose/xylose/arabinose/galactoside ABC-type transport system permease subunit
VTLHVEPPGTPSGSVGAPTSNSAFPSVPYIAWDAVLLVAAAVTLAGFVVIEDVPGELWKILGLRTSISLLAALALYLSVRFRVPNLAVASIALFASLVAGKAAGPDGSSLTVIGLAVVIGVVIGIMLAGLVVGLRIPAWGATLGVTGLLLAWSLKLTNGETSQVAIGNTVTDLGIPLLLITIVVSIGLAIASLVLIAPGEDDRSAPRQPSSDNRARALQCGALVVSSAIAALAGALLALRSQAVNGQTGLDLTVPLGILLLCGASLRGRGSGVVGLAAAAIVIETASIWSSFRDGDFTDQLLIAGGLAFVGLIVGGVLELVSSQRPPVAEPWQTSPPPPSSPPPPLPTSPLPTSPLPAPLGDLGR